MKDQCNVKKFYSILFYSTDQTYLRYEIACDIPYRIRCKFEEVLILCMVGSHAFTCVTRWHFSARNNICIVPNSLVEH